MNPPNMPAKFIRVVRIGRAMMQARDAGDDQIPERVDGRGLERVDLLGDPHRAELGADAGADRGPRASSPARQRPGLAHQRDGEPGRDHRLGAEPLERGPRVHRQHDADRHPGDGDQRRGAQPQLEQLPDGLAELDREARTARGAP